MREIRDIRERERERLEILERERCERDYRYWIEREI